MTNVSQSTAMTGHRKARQIAFLSVTLGFAILAAPAHAMSPGDKSAEPTPTATEPAPRPDDSSGLLRIEVASTIDDENLLPGWISSRNRDLAAEIPAIEGHDQWIAVEITGATYDYRVSVVAMRDGEPVGPTSEPIECVCNSEKLLALIDDRIDDAIAEFRAAKAADTRVLPPEPEPTPPGPVLVPQPEVDGGGTGRRGPLGALGYTGIAVGVLGIGALGAGIPLALRPDEPRGNPPMLERHSTHSPGIALAISGGAALVTGITLLVVDRVRPRRRSLAVLPTFGSGRVGLSITRSF